jgi:uncharacterized membrane-anchored protein YitT (DUF2179 family)
MKMSEKEKCVKKLIDAKDDEIIDYVLRKPSLREKLINTIKEEVEGIMEDVFVNAIRAANERPPIWWQWLMLIIVGALSGIGIGIVLALKGGLVGSPVPPPPPS